MSTPAASSTLSRSRAAILIITTVVAAYGFYYLHSNIYNDSENSTSTPSLHRSNAVHRRRRRTGTGNVRQDGGASDDQIDDEDADIIASPLNDGETVVDEGGYQDEYNWTDVPPGYQRTGQNIVQLLFRVSEDATRRSSTVHRGCGCNSCGVVPIRGVRYRCSNCVDFDLCESCEAQGLHTKTHIFYKVKIPAPSFGPQNIQPVWYSGDPDSCQRMLPKELITKLSNATGYERPELDAYWEQWTYMANTEWREDPDEVCLAMDRKTFERCLVPSTSGSRFTAPSLIFDRMFAFYDTNKDNLIGFSEFLHGLAFRKKRDKWSKIFEGYDIDGDGFVDRKDFLRLFRAYYVMYRQMHREMLEGYDDQVMNSTDVQQLVSGRQPLSSAFGRDGRFPTASFAHTGVGKSPQVNGDLEITDGRGVINENTLDHGNREDVFIRPMLRSSNNSRRTRGSAIGTRQYASALLDPPTTVDQLTRTILDGLAQGSGFETLDDLIDNSRFTSGDERDGNGSSSDEDDEARIKREDDRRWPPSFVTNAVVEEVLGPGFDLNAEVLKGERLRQAVIAHALAKGKARREVHERWVRRQFYTDEEEGGSPPADWDDSEDVIVRNIGKGESSKAQSQSRTSPRSRSSSKVRFAEAEDDFEIRSNPSTSSRSVPERWGGIEIADAEKDAGKEILYQITQQAFNELLDPIFKEKENIAEAVALTKSDREKWKHLWSTPEFEAWAAECETKSKKPAEEDVFISKTNKDNIRPQSVLWPGFPGLPESEIEVDDLRRRPLPDLLAATGYSVAEPTEGSDAVPTVESISTTPPQPVLQNNFSSTETSEGPIDIPTLLEELRPASIVELDDTRNPISISATEIVPQDVTYRDPTMPQFRPDNSSSSVSPTPSPSEAVLLQKHGEVPDKWRLLMYWKLDRECREADLRGGYGKLDFKEWEAKIKSGIKTGKGNSMDYLGSWIEFCIP
ncbi:hypothetical protein BP6252_03706 [Coleophoma cylindrospora]|uniref:Uncharacterized protein n=1 Tax=Coleophoma cylindrospora TaxID=1849047 RepID=A0A3D8S921_9HELO|nr:hypothetical protein BP6252_03706 [Coleophoma cylindrospora]